MLGTRGRFEAGQAARALGALGPRAATAVPALVRALDGSGASKAVSALGAIGPAARAAIPAPERRRRRLPDHDRDGMEACRLALRRIRGL